MDALQNRFDCETSRRNDARGKREKDREREKERSKRGREGCGRLKRRGGMFEERRLGSLKARRRVSRRTIIICTPVIFHVRRPWIMAVAVDANDLGLITTVCPPARVSHCRWNDGGLFFSSAMSPPTRGRRESVRELARLHTIRSGSGRKGNTFFCVFNYAEIRFILNDPPLWLELIFYRSANERFSSV